MSNAVLLQPVVRWWHCPSCDARDRTDRNDAHTRMHDCPALNGLNVPLVEVATSDAIANARHVVNGREDYLGAEIADPIMSVTTERADGSSDCTIYAPTSSLAAEGIM